VTKACRTRASASAHTSSFAVPTAPAPFIMSMLLLAIRLPCRNRSLGVRRALFGRDVRPAEFPAHLAALASRLLEKLTNFGW